MERTRKSPIRYGVVGRDRTGAQWLIKIIDYVEEGGEEGSDCDPCKELLFISIYIPRPDP